MMITIMGIGLSLVLIMFLIRWKVPISLAMFAGAVLAGLMSGFSHRDFFHVLVITLQHPTTWLLAITVGLISGLGATMGKAGRLGLLIDSLQRLFKDTRYILMALPSLIGVLMVPGGAIMSAPLVGEVGQRQGLSREKMTVINMVFRHIWYLVFPLFPSMILATQLADMGPLAIVIFNAPIVVITIAIAFKLYFAGWKNVNNDEYNGWDPRALKSLFRAVLPMLVIVVLALGFNVYFPLAVFCGIVVLYLDQWLEKRLAIRVFSSWLLRGIKWHVALVVIAILFFKDVLDLGGGVEELADFLFEMGIPLLALLALVPFLIGFVTGYDTAAIGISFPLFLPLLPAEEKMYYIAFIYTMSIAGYIISPLHLCLILTREHFQSSLGLIYRIFWVPAAVIVFLGFLSLFLWTGLG